MTYQLPGADGGPAPTDGTSLTAPTLPAYESQSQQAADSYWQQQLLSFFETSDQYGNLDLGGTSTYQPPGGMPTRFMAEVLSVLSSKGINWRALGQEQVTKLIGDLWSKPGVQDLVMAGSPATAEIGKALFTPNEDDPMLVQQGLGLLAQAGQTLTATQQRFLTSGGTGTAAEQNALESKVIEPFANYGIHGGNDYGQAVDPDSISGGYGPIHMGVDYATPAGTAIFSPFGGTVHVQTGLNGYGNLVYVELPTGEQLRFGHVAGAADGIVDGMHVDPGDQIAVSGANVGVSQGAVTLVEWKDKSGNYMNPHDVLDPIWSGTTYQKLGLGLGSIGAGISKAQAEQRKYGITDPTKATVYSGATGLWKQYFGREPTTPQLTDLIANGKDSAQWEDYIRKMGSHIDGMNMGQYGDFRTLLDKTSQTYLGHASTDGVVKDLWKAQTTTPDDVTTWYKEHSPDQIAAAEK